MSRKPVEKNARLLAGSADTFAEDHDDKYEEYSTIDSGFISSGNLIVSSEEIRCDEEEEHNKPRNVVDDPGPDDVIEEDTDSMYVDSGVCLSDNFSNLSITNTNQNNLGSASATKNVSTATTKPVESKTDGGKFTDPETLWKIFYEQDEDGDTHLHISIFQGFIEAVLALIRVAPHPRLLDTPNDEATTPLHLAVAMGYWRIARWLIVAGARPGPRNLRGDSPIHLAARLGSVQCLKAIVEPVHPQEREALGLSYPPQPYTQCDLNQWNYDGQTCVHVAASNGNVDMLSHLVRFGADINAREGKSGYTALHYAVERQDDRMIKHILNECDELNVLATTYGGRSALQLDCPIESHTVDALKRRGVAASPFTSDDEFSEDEVSY